MRVFLIHVRDPQFYAIPTKPDRSGDPRPQLHRKVDVRSGRSDQKRPFRQRRHDHVPPLWRPSPGVRLQRGTGGLGRVAIPASQSSNRLSCGSRNPEAPHMPTFRSANGSSSRPTIRHPGAGRDPSGLSPVGSIYSGIYRPPGAVNLTVSVHLRKLPLTH